MRGTPQSGKCLKDVCGSIAAVAIALCVSLKFIDGVFLSL